MKKNISIILTLASLFIILDAFNVGHAIVAFMLTGTIPGTNITISATVMLMLYAVIAGFIFARILGTSRSSALQSRQS